MCVRLEVSFLNEFGEKSFFFYSCWADQTLHSEWNYFVHQKSFIPVKFFGESPRYIWHLYKW